MTRLPSLRMTGSRRAALERAVAAFAAATGLRFDIVEPPSGAAAEATIELDGARYDARIRLWAQHAPLVCTIEQIKRHPAGILVADYVSPERADRLREADVAFIDTVGNAYLRTPRCYVFIKGHARPRPVPGFGKPLNLPAFSSSGAKVTFALLCRPELANADQVQVAEVAGVSPGTVAHVFESLGETGHIQRRGGSRTLARQEDLLDGWVERYAYGLRPTLWLGNYQAEQARWWKTFDVSRYGAYWGGEIAGAVYTEGKAAGESTLYIPKALQMQLVSAAHLRKIPRPSGGAGTVTLLAPFWHWHEGPPGLVHPLLAYADLIASEQARNIETARRLYEKHLRPRLTEES